MSDETKRGPYGEVVDIDGSEWTLASRARRLWAATEGIRYIAALTLVGIGALVALLVLA